MKDGIEKRDRRIHVKTAAEQTADADEQHQRAGRGRNFQFQKIFRNIYDGNKQHKHEGADAYARRTRYSEINSGTEAKRKI